MKLEPWPGMTDEERKKLQEFNEKRDQLEFLQTQLDLLEIIKEYNLDPDEVLGGLELGLDANIEELLTALSAALGHIIGQAENDASTAQQSEGER